ncbi:hypothetical protein OW763_04075 [Clostridium aestuarii]|uniref:Cell division protein FtsL n=1 Tax=Clostridium aestuarii TaxID=338193 RepID=A0ABT4CX15_9CLOT|nr:hypothetical protein [Clostridium aestuarii]MCY6483536.1 hypothetical protein [Clostridium aestuarii]
MRGKNIIRLCFCITVIALTFFGNQKIKKLVVENNSLQTKLQVLKQEESNLNKENDKLSKNHLDIEKKIDEIENKLK